MSRARLPGIKERMQAVLIDVVLIFATMFAATKVFEQIGNVGENPRMWLFIFLFVIYDPLFTSAFGGTLGHRAMGLRVRREDNLDKNINIFLAFFRFGLKGLLGWISLLVIGMNDKGKAIHDYIAMSVVIYKDEPNPFGEVEQNKEDKIKEFKDDEIIDAS